MTSTELAQAAAVIASGFVQEHKLVQLSDGVLDSIASIAVTLAVKIEAKANTAYTRGR